MVLGADRASFTLKVIFRTAPNGLILYLAVVSINFIKLLVRGGRSNFSLMVLILESSILAVLPIFQTMPISSFLPKDTDTKSPKEIFFPLGIL